MKAAAAAAAAVDIAIGQHGCGVRVLTDIGAFHAQLDQELYARYRPQGTSAWSRWAIKAVAGCPEPPTRALSGS